MSAASEKDADFGPNSMAQTPRGALQPEIIYKEVCCCHFGKKATSKESECGCLRRKATPNCKDATTRETSEKKAVKRAPWQHIVMKVRSRKRLESGEMGNVVQAINMLSGEKCSLMVSPKMIDQQDHVGLERLLRKHVELAPADVSIYIQISEQLLKKQAKAI